MVHIISGKKNSGKTSRLIKIHTQIRSGGGFFLNKIIQDGIFTGYDLSPIGGGPIIPFAYRPENLPPEWQTGAAFGGFYFSEAGIRAALAILGRICGDTIEPVFIDEIGPLELKGQGLHPALKKVFRIKHTVYITVRTACLDRVIKKYRLKQFRIIQV